MSTHARRILLVALTLLTVPAVAVNFPTFTVPQFTVLGCTFNGSVGTFTTCIISSSTDAVKDAEEQVRTELESSPFMAQLDAERELLRLARDSGVADLAECMGDAGLNFATVAGSIAANPMGVAGNRLQELIGVLQNQGPQRLAGTYNPAAGGQEPSVQQRINEAYQTLRDLAAADPLANCLLPMLDSQESLLKSTSAAIYQDVSGQLNAIRNSVVEPEIRRRQQMLMASMLQEMRITTAPKAAPSTPARKVSPQRRTREMIVQPPSGEGLSKSRQTAPRTRSIGSFLSEKADTTVASVKSGIETATPAVRGMIESSLPDDVQRIALAEFTGHVLAPVPLTVAAGELEQLAEVVAGTGSLPSVSQLDTLFEQLELTNEDMYTRIALATIRFYGHKVVDEAGYPMVDWLWGSVAGIEAVADNAVGEICAIGYYATSLPCAGVKSVVSFLVHSALITSVTKASVVVMHEAWDRAVECGAAAIAGAPADNRCSMLSPMLQGFPRTNQQALSFIMPHLDATQRALFDYQRAVNALAEAVRNGVVGR